jgi:hypothetical protein
VMRRLAAVPRPIGARYGQVRVVIDGMHVAIMPVRPGAVPMLRMRVLGIQVHVRRGGLLQARQDRHD